MRRAPPTTPRPRFLSMLKTPAPPHRQILIGFASIVGAIPMASEETVRAEIGHILVATWPWRSKGYMFVPSSAQLQREGNPMACFRRLTLRPDTTAAVRAIDSEAGPGIGLNGPGSLLRARASPRQQGDHRLAPLKSSCNGFCRASSCGVGVDAKRAPDGTQASTRSLACAVCIQ